jgi:hypothetical protein
MTTEDVAALFKVRPRVVYRWRREPGCPLRGVKVGTRRFYSEAELRAFLDFRRAQEYAA